MTGCMIIDQLREKMEAAENAEHELESVRATLLVNFVPGPVGRRHFGIEVDPEWGTNRILEEVLRQLTEKLAQWEKI